MVTQFKKSKKGETRQTIFFSIFLGCLILIVIGFLVISNWKINQKRVELRSQIEALRKEIQILEEKKQELEAGISQTKGEEYLEKEAREKLGLKKPGEEVVAILPPEKNEEDYNPPTTRPWKKFGEEAINLIEKILEKLKFW